MIDVRSFFETFYKNAKKIATGQGDDYTTVFYLIIFILKKVIN